MNRQIAVFAKDSRRFLEGRRLLSVLSAVRQERLVEDGPKDDAWSHNGKSGSDLGHVSGSRAAPHSVGGVKLLSIA